MPNLVNAKSYFAGGHLTLLQFQFNADAYLQSIHHELIPEGQYRAKILSLNVSKLQDGSDRLLFEFQVTWRNATFKDSLFLNPSSHPYFYSSNKRFGDLCMSCKVDPVAVQQNENILIGCTCGIEIVHKKSKDGSSQFNTVKKFLNPNETERLRQFPQDASSSDPNDMQALDPSDPATWFGSGN